MLCVLAASCLSCRKQVERIEYLPNYHQMYLFQNKSSSDYVLFRIYSSGPGGRAEDGFFVGKGYKDDSYHDVYSFDGANPFYLLPDATENYTTISNGKVSVRERHAPIKPRGKQTIKGKVLHLSLFPYITTRHRKTAPAAVGFPHVTRQRPPDGPSGLFAPYGFRRQTSESTEEKYRTPTRHALVHSAPKRRALPNEDSVPRRRAISDARRRLQGDAPGRSHRRYTTASCC